MNPTSGGQMELSDNLKTPTSSPGGEKTPSSYQKTEIVDEVINLQSLLGYTNETSIQENSLPQTDVLNQEEFDKAYGFRRTNFTLARHVVHSVKRIRRYKSRDWWCWLRRRAPILGWLTAYSWRRDLIWDLIGGLMVSIMCVPQALAYSMLVGVPPNYGLYTSFIGPLIYAVFGSSKHTSPGSFAIVSMMIGSLVAQLSGGEEAIRSNSLTKQDLLSGFCCTPKRSMIGKEDKMENAVGIATGISLLVGVFQIIFGAFNAGLLAVWLSDYLVQGLTTGAAIHVLLSQMKAMTGVSGVPLSSESVDWGFAQFGVCFFANVREQVQLADCVCSTVCILLLLISSYIIDPILQKWCKAFKFPMELLLVIFSTVINSYMDELSLPRVGKVQNGFVALMWPDLSQFDSFWQDAMLIAVISFVIHIALAKLVSKQFNYTIDPNQEWFALGMMHVLAAPFGCFAGGSSLGRTMTLVKFETRSQLTTIVSAVFILLMILWAAPSVEYLPKSVLAVIIVMAMKDLMLQVRHSLRLLQHSTTDFLIYFVTLITVVFYNLTKGLIVGVSFALLSVIFRSQWAESTCMGRIPGTFDFKGLDHYKEADAVDGLLVFRFDAPLYFANAETFIEKTHEATNINPIIIRAQMDRQLHNEARKKEKDRCGACWKGWKMKIIRWFTEKKITITTKAENQSADPLIQQQAQQKHKIQFRVKNKDVKVEKKENETPRSGEENLPPIEVENVAITHVVLDCSCINYVDLMGQHALEQVYKEYASIRISVLYAAVKASVRQFIDKGDFHKIVPKNRMFVSVADAVQQAQREHDLPYEKRQVPIATTGPAVPQPKDSIKARSLPKSTTAVKGLDESIARLPSLEDTQPVSVVEHETGGRRDNEVQTEADVDHLGKPELFHRRLTKEPSLQHTQVD